MMETPQSKPWKDGDEIHGVVLSCSTGSESRGVREFLRSEYDMVSLGSQSNSNVRDPTMAAMHAVLYLRKNEVRVRVIDNASGVIKNGQRVYGEGKVNDGDELRFGSFMVKVMMKRQEIGLAVATESAPEPESEPEPTKDVQDQPVTPYGSFVQEARREADSAIESFEDADAGYLEGEALRLLARVSTGEIMAEKLFMMQSNDDGSLKDVFEGLRKKLAINSQKDAGALAAIIAVLKTKKEQQ